MGSTMGLAVSWMKQVKCWAAQLGAETNWPVIFHAAACEALRAEDSPEPESSELFAHTKGPGYELSRSIRRK